MRIDEDAWRPSGDHGDDIGSPDDSPANELIHNGVAASSLPSTPAATLGKAVQVALAQVKQTPDTALPEAVFRDSVIALIPALRLQASARASSRNETDDLVQETLARAWRYRRSFHEGTNLKAWLCKIMQNCLYHSLAKQRDTVEDVEGRWAARQAVAPSQEWHIQYNDMLNALDRLPPDARAALVLIGASGWSYEEAARLANCPVGTLKSRVNRAREKLASLIDSGQVRLPRPDAAPVKPAPSRPFREQACQVSMQSIKD
jgi:RNA polymerase sigma-70 factor (ECF subfamily)